jgi:ribonucleotide monophosphatase NagD (HAD superfamily)
MIDNIMRNTYGVLTNRCSIEDILEQYEGKDAMFYGNPYDITIDDIYEVISYFEDTEEYEKCMELVYVQNDIRVNKLIKECL